MDLNDIPGSVQYIADFEHELAQYAKSGEIKGASHFAEGNAEQLIKIFRGLKPEDCVGQHDIKCIKGQILKSKLIVIPNPGSVFSPEINQGIRKQDYIFTSYRSHPHALLKGMPREELKQKILDGKSMYPMSSVHNIIASGIVPGHLPQAVGLAMAFKRDGLDKRVWAFCGDMAAETGTFHECTKYAQKFELPITFVIEDNGLSVETPTREVWGMPDYHIPLLRSNTIYYKYTNSFKHQGAGREVGF